jgi:hypothetical protein
MLLWSELVLDLISSIFGELLDQKNQEGFKVVYLHSRVKLLLACEVFINIIMCIGTIMCVGY